MAAAGGGAALRGASALVSMPLRKSLPSSDPRGLSALPAPDALAGASLVFLALLDDLAGAAAAGFGVGFSGLGFAFAACFSAAGLGGAGVLAVAF